LSHHHTLVKGLRDQGYRLTPQRDIILTAIRDAQGHFTAEQIYQQVHAQSPVVNRATVYRTLELLSQIGIIAEIDLGGACREYELCGDEPHHHLVCQRCEMTLTIPHDLVQPLVEVLRDELGFQADLDHLSVFGLCAQCQKEIA
jgi:Fur family ferric uptake transcriptional regulator